MCSEAGRGDGRRGRRLGSVLAGVLLLALLGAAIGAGPVAAESSGVAPDADPLAVAADPCEDVERPAVVVTTGPDAPYGPGEVVAVYPGSELAVALCDEPDGERSIRPTAPDGLELLDRSGETARVRVGHGANASLGPLVGPDAVPGPRVAAVGARVEIELLDAPLTVDTAQRADGVAAAEATYRERAADYRERLDALAAATAAIEAGERPVDDRPSTDPLNATLEARAAYLDALSAYRGELYAVADGGGGRDAGTALLSLEARHEELAATAETRIRAHDAALADRERDLSWALRLRILGLGLVGVLVGSVAGALVPVRRGRTARRRLERGEWTTYSRTAALLPATAGLLLLLLALGWLALAAGPILLEVLR